MIVEAPDLDPIEYVRSLEAEPLFDGQGGAGARGPARDHVAGAGVNAPDRALRPQAAEPAGNARLRWGAEPVRGDDRLAITLRVRA